MKLKLGYRRALVRYIVFILSVLSIFLIIPKEGKFKYEYERYKLWQHDDLISPFSFAIRKTEEEINSEYNQIRVDFRPLYNKNTATVENFKEQFKKHIKDYLKVNYYTLYPGQLNLIIQKANKILDTIYLRGIIPGNDPIIKQAKDSFISVNTDNIYEDIRLSDVYTPEQADLFAGNAINNDAGLNKILNISKFFKLIAPNLSYNKLLSEKMLKEKLSEVSLTKGMIQEGEKIIAKGNIVSPEKYQILQSLKSEYEYQLNSGKESYFILSGYFLLVTIIIFTFILFLRKFYRTVYRSNKNVFLILFNIIFFVSISAYIVKYSTLSIYLIPYCILPIIIMSFFDSRVAFYSHLVTVILVSVFAPNSFEFIFIQVVAGLTIIIALSRIRYLSQFFITTLFILLVYTVSYLGLKLVEVRSFREIDLTNFFWFTGSFILTLLAYPLQYAYEKLFGFVSDITLIELSDINKKILRELSMKAPGTFQHSLQVANLAETIINDIGGNSLLARVGALYHDIGKIHSPSYFIENQVEPYDNPHNTLNEKDSSKVIVDHVEYGSKLAKEYKLPKPIIEFIVSHHGTSRTEFFYRTYKKNNPEEEIDESDFRYPGPRPTSKEMAVVMLVDGVEAATRSIKDITEEAIDEMVDRIIDQKLYDKQLEESDISLREIYRVRSILKASLKSIHHSRIEYPELKVN